MNEKNYKLMKETFEYLASHSSCIRVHANIDNMFKCETCGEDNKRLCNRYIAQQTLDKINEPVYTLDEIHKVVYDSQFKDADTNEYVLFTEDLLSQLNNEER